MDIVPSEGQYGYLHGAEIPYPYFGERGGCNGARADTATKMKTTHLCPRYLFNMATKYRVRVSHFQEPVDPLSPGFGMECRTNGKPAMFCYAVYCQETGHPFGHAPIESDAPEFAGSCANEKAVGIHFAHT